MRPRELEPHAKVAFFNEDSHRHAQTHSTFLISFIASFFPKHFMQLLKKNPLLHGAPSCKCGVQKVNSRNDVRGDHEVQAK